MQPQLLFDFNNILLFSEKPSLEIAGSNLIEIAVPQSWSSFFYLNTELLTFIKEQQEKGVLSSLLSASEYSLYQPQVLKIVQPLFNHIFLCKDLGWSKDIPATYLAAAKKLGNQPKHIVFMDDRAENIAAAKLAGMQTIHYTSNKELLADLKPLLA